MIKYLIFNIDFDIDIDIDIDIDVNVWDNAGNVTEPISFHRFRGQTHSTIYIWCYHHSSIGNWKLHTDKNYNNIEMLLISHLSNLWYVIRRVNYDALSLAALSRRFFSPIWPPGPGWNNWPFDRYRVLQKSLWCHSIWVCGEEWWVILGIYDA
jgi:hypothetical protein